MNYSEDEQKIKFANRNFNLGLPEDLRENLKWMEPTSLFQHEEAVHCGNKKACILIIDDNVSFRGIIKTILENEGFTVEYTDNGRLGLNIFLGSPEKYSAILTDIHMPGLDGYQLAERIRGNILESISQVPIIAISGEAQLEGRYEKYFTHYFQKPFDLDRFVFLLNKLTGKTRK